MIGGAGVIYRQRGMTLWGLLYVLITLGLMGMVGVRSVPVYLNAYDIHTDLSWAAHEPELQDADAQTIQRALQRRFDAGYVTNIRGRDIAVHRVGRHRELEVRYAVQRPFLFNIDMVYSFDYKAVMSGGSGA